MKPVGIKISGNTVKGHAVYILGIDDCSFQGWRCNASLKQSFGMVSPEGISQRLIFVILPPFLALFQAVTELGNIEFSRSVFVFWKSYMPFLFPLCSIKICPPGINICEKKKKNFSALHKHQEILCGSTSLILGARGFSPISANLSK